MRVHVHAKSRLELTCALSLLRSRGAHVEQIGGDTGRGFPVEVDGPVPDLTGAKEWNGRPYIAVLEW